MTLAGATSSQGSCKASGGGYACKLGEIKAGGKLNVILKALGVKSGAGTIQAQVLTSANDPDQSNNVATATVTVKAASNGGGGNNGGGSNNGGGGGGAFGWFALAMLLGLTLTGGYADRRRRMR